jgi:hypothetical protein
MPAEDVEETATVDLAAESQGLGARLSSFLGRDLNGNGGEHRREPSLGEPAPSVRLGSSDRAIHAATLEEADDDEPPVGRPNGVRLDKEGLETLRSVLQDLMECRRLIEAAVARPE